MAGRSISMPANGRDLESMRVASRLKLYFAMLSCLGGLVLSAGNQTESIPVIAVFFAVFGYVFVDWLELFALPPIAAYAAMAVAALYCVSDFSDLDSPGNQQMVAVAELLVFVQAILMLQRKSRRIFEQLGVFCLLELIVAAVFNNAINYGLLLIPISIIGAWALSLLSAVAAWEGLEGSECLGSDEVTPRRGKRTDVITFSAPESVHSLAMSARKLPRIALLTMAPSIILVGGIFFYALPRTTDAARMADGSNALVGFSDKLLIEQIGTMMQSSESALRIHIRNQANHQPYRLSGGMYLRGQVLENYIPRFDSRRAASIWTAQSVGAISGSQRLPPEYISKRTNDRNFYDTVTIDVTCESMKSDSLFAVAPYHRRRNDPDIVHRVDRWTIARRLSQEYVYPRISYSFASNAFRGGVQTDLIARRTNEAMMAMQLDGDGANRERSYMEVLTKYDADSIPSAALLAGGVVQSIPRSSRNNFYIAKAMEQYLANNNDFRYTLNLTADSVPGYDPLEQFLSIDRKGHCQYFASALVMMLRSQGIPARIVVGYRTEEFNDLGQYYVARQLHAHAWVEALIARDELPATKVIYGQPPTKSYWLRLDPTPGGGGVAGEETGGVGQLVNLAQNIWDDYVVDMDANRQDEALLGAPGMTPMSDSYSRLIDALTQKIAQVRAGELGGGALATRREFSWSAAVLGVMLTLVIVVLFKIRLPGWLNRKIRGKMDSQVERPSIAFYAQTLDQLERVGVKRGAAQTPAELAEKTGQSLSHPMIPSIANPLGVLTGLFYLTRFRASDDVDGRQNRNTQLKATEALDQLTRSVDLMTADSKTGERAP